MKYIQKDNNIIVWQNDFNLNETLDCGQAFRWEKISTSFDCTYKGFYLNHPITISAKGDHFIFHDTSEQDFLNIWVNYFDFETDYGKIKKLLSKDKTLAKACEFAGGIRLLRQDKWEALCSFIISQNNNIPRIKGIISRLCAHYQGFPSPQQLALENIDSLSFLRAGFRAKYLLDASRRIANGELDLGEIAAMPINDARKALMSIKGVGPKVAECALLYGMYRIEAFPIDVWIKRVLEQYYPNGFPEFANEYAGIAQQYLFHYIRSLQKSTTQMA